MKNRLYLKIIIGAVIIFAGIYAISHPRLGSPVSEGDATQIAKQTVIAEAKKRNWKDEDTDFNRDDITAKFYPNPDYLMQHFLIPHTKEINADNGYWEVKFVPKKYHFGGYVVFVDYKTGQSSKLIFLK